MLTESEREWLEDRKYTRFHYSCQWCSQYDPMLIMPDKQDVPCMWYATCPCNTNNYDYKDAAEFSERVAKKLADAYWPPLVYTPVAPFEQLFMPPMDRLKWARIEVEEEMDNGA